MKYKDIVTRILDNELGEMVQDELARRHAKPCYQMRFHELMVDLLPKRARIRKAWHRLMHRRWQAYCEAAKDNDKTC